MLPSSVPPAEPAEVVAITGFTSYELVEMRRGLVQRLTVAQSNIRDKRNTDDVPDWRDVYEDCWSAYSKISKALAPPEKSAVSGAVPPCDDEFDYLSRPVGED